MPNESEPDNRLPSELWTQLPLGIRLLEIRLSSGEVIDEICVDETGAIEGQLGEGIAGYHGGLNPGFRGVDSSSIQAIRPSRVPWYRFRRNPWIERD